MMPTWEYEDLPECVKDEAEMRLYCADQNVYDTYGVDLQRGALVLIRPDGVVTMITDLEGRCFDGPFFTTGAGHNMKLHLIKCHQRIHFWLESSLPGLRETLPDLRQISTSIPTRVGSLAPQCTGILYIKYPWRSLLDTGIKKGQRGEIWSALRIQNALP